MGLTAPGSDFTVSGSPVTGSGTLGLGWTVAPTSADTANAIVKRDAGGNFSATQIAAASVVATNTGTALAGTMSSSSAVGAVAGTATATGTGPTYGVVGNTSTTAGVGVLGQTNNGGYGVMGLAVGTSGQGVRGEAFGTQNSNFLGPDGVDGFTHTDGASGVGGFNTANGYGVYGSGGAFGVYGIGTGTYGVGVSGIGSVYSSGVTGNGAIGVYGIATSFGEGISGSNGGVSGALAGFFDGSVEVTGTLSALTKYFKIDHPLDPAGKYLMHASVESSELMDIYTGNVVTGATGDASVDLPEWFEALNRDFCYQLTVIGQPAQAFVAEEIAHHQFRIKTDKPNVKVSWQVTAVRQDAYAKANPLAAEQDKPERERGYYLHPGLFGASPEKAVTYARHPEFLKHRISNTNSEVK